MLDHLFLDKPWFLSAWAVLSVFFWWYLPKGCEQDFCGDADRRVARVIVAVLGGGILTALVIPGVLPRYCRQRHFPGGSGC